MSRPVYQQTLASEARPYYLTVTYPATLEARSDLDFSKADVIREFLGGPFQVVPIPSPSGRQLVGYIHEEAKLEGMPVHFNLPGVDVIAGPMVIMAVEGSQEVPLTREEVAGLAMVRPVTGAGLPYLILLPNPNRGSGKAHNSML